MSQHVVERQRMTPCLNCRAPCVPRCQLRSLLLLLLGESLLLRVAIGTAAGAASSTDLNYLRTTEEGPAEVFYWPLKNATSANGASALTYEERALALAFQGIVNSAEDLEGGRRRKQAPSLFFDAVSAGSLSQLCSTPHGFPAAAFVLLQRQVACSPLFCLTCPAQGALDFDWSAADQYWHDTLQQQGRVQFTSLEPTLCALLGGGDPS